MLQCQWCAIILLIFKTNFQKGGSIKKRLNTVKARITELTLVQMKSWNLLLHKFPKLNTFAFVDVAFASENSLLLQINKYKQKQGDETYHANAEDIFSKVLANWREELIEIMCYNFINIQNQFLERGKVLRKDLT